jgi:hypothetical protein
MTERYLARWVEKDHFPGPDEDYDCAKCKYGEAAFPATKGGLQRAINRVHEGAHESGVEWGNVHLQYEEVIDRHYSQWLDADEYEPEYHL